ncbi:NADH-quinone oxidoreductase subunit J [bacterium]|nr:NADH-quinone oxidoreductase subunit J [bacterium]
MATIIGFYLLALLAIGAGIMLVNSRNLLHALLGLAVASLAVAGLMLGLRAEFLALVLVLIYVGAVVVLGVFAVMLTGHFEKSVLPPGNELKILGGGTALALLVLVTGVILIQPLPPDAVPAQVPIQKLGVLLMTDYVLPFELVSVLLLAVLVGAIVIARGKED